MSHKSCEKEGREISKANSAYLDQAINLTNPHGLQIVIYFQAFKTFSLRIAVINVWLRSIKILNKFQIDLTNKIYLFTSGIEVTDTLYVDK